MDDHFQIINVGHPTPSSPYATIADVNGDNILDMHLPVRIDRGSASAAGNARKSLFTAILLLWAIHACNNSAVSDGLDGFKENDSNNEDEPSPSYVKNFIETFEQYEHGPLPKKAPWKYWGGGDGGGYARPRIIDADCRTTAS